MTALLAVEGRRVLARRLVRASVALAVLAILAGATIAFLVSRDVDRAALARAQAARQAAVQRCTAGQLDGVPSDVPPQKRSQFCEQQFIPPVEDPRFLYETLPDILVGMSPFAISLGWLLGASLVGAEWHAGTMVTLLTWEPRRVRVLAAKLAAAGALAFTLTVGLQLLLGAALLPAGLLRGSTDGVDAAWVRSLAGVGLRVAAVAVLGAAMGLSLATIGRNTAAALGIAFGYFAIVENAIRSLRPGWAPWLLGDNIVVVISNQPQSSPPIARSTLGAASLLGLLHAGVGGPGRGQLPPARPYLTGRPIVVFAPSQGGGAVAATAQQPATLGDLDDAARQPLVGVAAVARPQRVQAKVDWQQPVGRVTAAGYPGTSATVGGGEGI